MEGCGWSTERARELLWRMGGAVALRPLLEAEWTLSPVEDEIARLKLQGARAGEESVEASAGGALQGGAAGGAAGARRQAKGSGKKGKKGKK